jgi:hypothetical protein
VAEQAGGERGDARSNPAAAKRSDPRTRWRGARAAGSQPATRAASGPVLGVLRPCARCSLTARVHRRDTQARTGADPEPKGAGESRSGASRGARPGVPGRISGDPEIGVTARHATGAAFRASACRRSAPLVFFGGAETDEGHPAPSPNRAMPLGCLTIEDDLRVTQASHKPAARHCERKRSNPEPKAKRGLLRRCAPRNDEDGAAGRPPVSKNSPTLRKTLTPC